MPQIAICSALYEAGRPYLRAYKSGVRAATYGENAILVLAIDDLADPGPVGDALSEFCPVTMVRAPAGASPATVRRSLIRAACDSGAGILVFADMDDMLAPAAPGLFRDALAEADFAYGDLEIMDETGEPVGRRLFDGAGVPWRVESLDTIARRNFLGFSNTAVRTASIPEEALHMPADVVAADWWFFTTLVLAGRTGRRVPGAVSHYRQYPGSCVGADGPKSPATLRRMIDIACRHYRAYPGTPALVRHRHALEDLRETVQAMPDWQLGPAVAAMQGRPGVWYEPLWQLAATADEHPAVLDQVQA